MSGELENVSVGDYLAERGGWGGTVVRKIDRITKTQIITGGDKWSKDRGRLVGASSSSYNIRYVRPATKEDFLAARIQIAQRRVSQLIITEKNVGAAELLIAATDSGKAKP